MSMKEEGPPCAARVVDGLLRMGMAGLTWGFIAGSHDSSKEGYKGVSRASYVAKSVGRNGILWGCCAGMCYGFNCGLERMRRKRDWANASVAGALTGAIMAAGSGSGPKILATSATLAAIATIVDHLFPIYPPATVTLLGPYILLSSGDSGTRTEAKWESDGTQQPKAFQVACNMLP